MTPLRQPMIAALPLSGKGERTPLNHHLCPLEDTIVRAFRE